MVFKGDVTLNAGDRLILNARNFSATPGATVVLNAPYVDIGSGQRTGSWVRGSSDYIGQSTPGAVAGTAKLVINANLIDIEGDLRSGAGYSYTSRYNGAPAVSTAVSLPGFASMSFNSTGDIRLVTQLANKSTAGELLTLGDINFTAAQVYATTGAASFLEYGVHHQGEWSDQHDYIRAQRRGDAAGAAVGQRAAGHHRADHQPGRRAAGADGTGRLRRFRQSVVQQGQPAARQHHFGVAGRRADSVWPARRVRWAISTATTDRARTNSRQRRPLRRPPSRFHSSAAR